MADYFGDYMQNHSDDGDADNRVVRTTYTQKRKVAVRKRTAIAKSSKSSKSAKGKVTKKRSTSSSYAGKVKK
jgi:hypothetical protein